MKKLKSAIIDRLIDDKSVVKIPFSSVYKKAGEGGTPSTSVYEYYENGTIPFAKIDDLTNKYLITNKVFITELGLSKSSAWIIPTNSLIYSNGATIGAVSINTYPVCTKQGILGIVPKKEYDVEYLYYLLVSSYFRHQVDRIVTEGTIRTAYLKDINHIKCPIPSIEKQREISKILSTLSQKEELEEATLQSFMLQKKYLLKSMFI